MSFNEQNTVEHFIIHQLTMVNLNAAKFNVAKEDAVSLTNKLKNLKRQEFLMPEIEDQQTFIKLFQESQNICQQLKQQKATLRLLKQQLLNEILG